MRSGGWCRGVLSTWKSFPMTPLRMYTTPSSKKRIPRPNQYSRDSDGDGSLLRTRRIFVSNLSPTTTWQELKDSFKHIGPVAYASISKDMVTKLSKGCGLVQFENVTDVTKAIELMNGKMINGYQIRVSEDRQELKGGTTGVKNLTPSDKEQVKVLENESENTEKKEKERTKKVRMTSVESIEENQTKSHSTSVDSSKNSSNKIKDQMPKKKLSEDERRQYRIFVSGLPLTYKWMDVKDYFKGVGPVRYCDIYTIQGSGKSRGTAVVEFERKSDVIKAIELLNGAIVEPEKMMIRVAPFERHSAEHHPDSPEVSDESKTNNTRLAIVTNINPLVPILRQTPLPEEMKKSLALFADCRVFVNHLPRDLDWMIIKDTFSAIGPVAHVEILTDPHTGKSRGCGFIKYHTVNDAKKAIEVLHHSLLEGKRIEVVEYHEERTKRKDRTWKVNQFMKIQLPKEE